MYQILKNGNWVSVSLPTYRQRQKIGKTPPDFRRKTKKSNKWFYGKLGEKQKNENKRTEKIQVLFTESEMKL